MRTPVCITCLLRGAVKALEACKRGTDTGGGCVTVATQLAQTRAHTPPAVAGFPPYAAPSQSPWSLLGAAASVWPASVCLTPELHQSALCDGDAHSVQGEHKSAFDDLSVLFI